MAKPRRRSKLTKSEQRRLVKHLLTVEHYNGCEKVVMREVGRGDWDECPKAEQLLKARRR